MQFSAVDAALEGFRLTRERPISVLYWALAYLVFALLLSVAMVGLAGPAMGQLSTVTQSAKPDPEELLAAFGALAPFYLVLLTVSAMFYGIITAAVNRTVLRPEQAGFGGMRLGADELRMTAVLVGYWAIAFLAYMLGAFLVAIGSAIGAVAGPAAGATVAVALFAGLLCGIVFILVRLSFAAPMTLARGRMHILASWAATKGRFWPLLGAYVLAWILATVVSLLVVGIAAAVAVGVTGGFEAVGTLMKPEFTFTGYFTPIRFAYFLVAALSFGLTSVITTSPAAKAYRELGGDSASTFT